VLQKKIKQMGFASIEADKFGVSLMYAMASTFAKK
jgi:hypothetical protein